MFGLTRRIHSKESQAARILRLLKKKGTVTNRELNRICFRYGARIWELRREGHTIVSNKVRGGLWEFTYMPDDAA